MKVCERCGREIFTRDGDNACAKCDGKAVPKKRKRRKSMEEIAAEACGLVRVRGALGGVYYE